jgi:hypothetical protein
LTIIRFRIFRIIGSVASGPSLKKNTLNFFEDVVLNLVRQMSERESLLEAEG